ATLTSRMVTPSTCCDWPEALCAGCCAGCGWAWLAAGAGGLAAPLWGLFCVHAAKVIATASIIISSNVFFFIMSSLVKVVGLLNAGYISGSCCRFLLHSAV